MAWSPEGDRLACFIVHDHRVDIVFSANGDLSNRIELKTGGHYSLLTSAIWLPGDRLALADLQGNLHIADVSTGEIMYTDTNHLGAIEALAVSPDYKRIATAGQDGEVYIRLLPD